MNNFLLEQQQKSERIAILTEFIHSHPEARELKQAIAVKMASLASWASRTLPDSIATKKPYFS